MLNNGENEGIKEIQENYIPDGLHPNDNGNAVISHKLKKVFRTTLINDFWLKNKTICI